MPRYCHLSHEDRCQIAALLRRGVSQAEIARDIGVHCSTICRELQHNAQKTRYYHHHAQSLAKDRQAKRDSRIRKMPDFVCWK
jgi:transposase, IS30 family